MDMSLVEFTDQSLQEAKASWLAQALELDLPTVDIERLFSWSSSRINYAEKTIDSHPYGVFDDSKRCFAVVEIIHSINNPQKKLIKMLTVDLCPTLYASLIAEDMSKLDEIIDVYTCATFGTIELTDKHSVDAIKLYGRDEPMRLLLTVMKERIKTSSGINLNAEWEGRWLTLKS